MFLFHLFIITSTFFTSLMLTVCTPEAVHYT